MAPIIGYPYFVYQATWMPQMDEHGRIICLCPKCGGEHLIDVPANGVPIRVLPDGRIIPQGGSSTAPPRDQP